MNDVVASKKILYSPSSFAKKSLIYLQEIGILKSLKPHTSSRDELDSLLFFTVIEGNGFLEYQNKKYELKKGDSVFIDCAHKYAHFSDNWTISYIHFSGSNSKSIYQKYLERAGKNVFSSNKDYQGIIKTIYNIAEVEDYLKDMNIYLKIVELLNQLMSETIYLDSHSHKYEIKDIYNYLNENYINSFSLDELSDKFYINKYYLTRLFKKTYGTSIDNYLLSKRISKAKELLRFSNDNIDTIANKCGFKDPNYFSRTFKKIEGLTPKEYRKLW